jgi:hypothetical protein
MPQHNAFLAPPNGIMCVGQLNTSKTQIEKWFYVSGGAPPAADAARRQSRRRRHQPILPRPGRASASGRRGGGGGGNLNCYRELAAIDRATVKGTPLK